MSEITPVGLPSPDPACGRWQLLRCGLLNIYKFDEEEFRFEKGRLLLRGNNGTGKSRVLALQLPFLLDGDVSAHRVEPDRDPAKRMDWNLVQNKHADRTGYTWLELGLSTPEGDQFLTLGCGLRAVRGGGLIDRWYFITDLRVGAGLALQSSNGIPFARERLKEIIGDRGILPPSPAAYRRAIDERLFKLGERRYEALLDLLIHLRQPQLARKLDENLLSGALSEALPPLPTILLAEIAEAFRGLEADRVTLEGFVAARDATTRFMNEYRRYARAAARRRTDELRNAHSSYEEILRKVKSASEDIERAKGERDSVVAKLDATNIAHASAIATERTLAMAPEVQQVTALANARELAGKRTKEAMTAGLRLGRVRNRYETLATQAERARNALNEVSRSLVASVGNAEARADAAGLGAPVRSALLRARSLETLEAEHLPGMRRQIDAAVDRRSKTVVHLQKLVAVVTEKKADRDRETQVRDALSAQCEQALGAARDAEGAVDAALDEHAFAFRKWVNGLRELRIPSPELDREALEAWSRAPEGPATSEKDIRAAGDAASKSLASLRAGVHHGLRKAEQEVADLSVERDRLLEGHHEPPPAPHTRGVDVRTGTPGAPLWSLCDFVDEVEPDRRAGIEAALESSGLLDAWVMPDGRLLDRGVHDTAIIPASIPKPQRDRSLVSVLRPDLDARGALERPARETIVAILEMVALEDETAYASISASGDWKVGPLRGAWSKPAAQHIGATARETDRLARLAALEATILVARGRVAAAESEMKALEDREATAREEMARAPDASSPRRRIADLAAKTAHHAKLRAQLAGADERAVAARRSHEEAVRQLESDARDLNATEWKYDPAGLAAAIAGLRESVATVWPTIDTARLQRSGAREAEARAQGALDDQADAIEADVQAREEAAKASAERDVLEAAIGAKANEILERLSKARETVDRLAKEIENGQAALQEVTTKRAVLESGLARLVDERDAATQRRDAAVSRVIKLAETGLLPLVGVSLEIPAGTDWSPTRAVEVARRLDPELRDIDSTQAAWDKVQTEINRHATTLRDALATRTLDVVTSIDDQLFLVLVPFQGRSCTVSELHSALSEEVDNREHFLSARERELLEKHLIGEVSENLHDLLRGAETLVEDMNKELRARPMSTGLMLQLVWECKKDGPAGMADARALLKRAAATWSPAERTQIGAFLRQRIKEVRAEAEGGSWQDHLELAFDYRDWHRFTIERNQEGKWEPLTRATYGTGSGGEKAVALTIPQFAAAAAHYHSADPRAPRIILLDEAFAGVDPDMRGKCMGLIAAFDLDCILTSESEWGCYPTVPGIAIFHVTSKRGIDAIGVTRWVWNGRQRRMENIPASATRSETAEVGAVEDSAS